MQGIHSLYDLKVKLIQKGIAIIESEGWRVTTAHGSWTMSFGTIYLNGIPIKKLDDIPVLKKKIKKIQLKNYVD